MTDITERLRHARDADYETGKHICNMAVAEIERLREELEINAQAVGISEWRRQECLRLRAALEEIKSHYRNCACCAVMGERAEQALLSSK